MAISLFLAHKNYEIFRVAETISGSSGSEYAIEERVASGGNAVVHRCVETITGEEFAVKFQLSLAPSRSKRFLREIELLRGIQHEQLISYVDHGETDATVVRGRASLRRVKLIFLVMPLAETNLKELLRRESGRLLYEDYIAQFKGLATALGVLHKAAVHRDIKPENILVKGETWLLSDFGLCRFHDSVEDLTSPDEPMGPRYWMSPEALNRVVGNNDEISKRSDVFQLCSIFWFIVTGRHPSGCLCFDDWSGPENIFQVILDSLSHDENRRPVDGERLAELLHAATLPTAM